jgi:NAD(P)-dependent dehydrogenase (short-subunit alcohol dehydrogenase family)
MPSRTILITGANRGIGLELSEQFARDGWQVLACCRSPDDATRLKALAERDLDIEVFALDVTDQQQISALAEQLAESSIDLLLCNAGIYGPRGAAFGAVDAREWLQVLEVNTVAPLMLAQAFITQVAASQQKLVAVMSSKMGSIDDNSGGGEYIYRSSKTAVNQVVKSLSIDLADRGISAISLHPGWVRTDMGGANAEISTSDSASGLKAILQSAGPAQSGQFLEFNGSSIPW